MQTTNKFMDDIAKLATGAVGAAHSVKGEMESAFQAWLDRQLAGMDLVSREEFETVREMAEKAGVSRFMTKPFSNASRDSR